MTLATILSVPEKRGDCGKVKHLVWLNMLEELAHGSASGVPSPTAPSFS